MSNLDKLKNILQNYEAEYDHNDWIKLEKDLPKPSGNFPFQKAIIISVIIISTITGVILLVNKINKYDKNLQLSETIENNETTENNVVNISQNNSFENNLETKSKINSASNNSNIQNIRNDNKENKNITESEIKDKNENIINPSIIKNSEIHNTSKINSLPDLSNIKYEISVLDSCVPAKIRFSVYNIPEGCIAEWNTDENYRIKGNSVTHTYLKKGEYYPELNIIYNNHLLETFKLNKISIFDKTYVKIYFDNSNNLYYFSSSIDKNKNIYWNIDNQIFTDNPVSYEFKKSGDYKVKLTFINEFGCKSIAEETVNVHIEHLYYVPTAFIPNSNDVNSQFGPIGENMEFVMYQMVILDGNGQTVFVSDKPEYMWNGKINNIGPDAKTGIYLWEIKTLDKYGNLQVKKGRVNLIRN
jgi:hypothetical protein